MGSRPNIQPPHIEQSSSFGEIGVAENDEDLLDPMSLPVEISINVMLMSTFNTTLIFCK